MSIVSKIFGTLRTHKKKSIAIAIVVVLVGLGISSAMAPKAPEYVTEPVLRNDLRQTVEAVGAVTSERELDLKFAGIGVVNRVYVKEGDRVRAGQRLADLRAGSLAASVSAQSAALQSALADLRALEEGTRPEEIAIAEADLRNRKASLEVAKTTLSTAEQNLAESEEKLELLEAEVDVALSGQVTTSLNSLALQLVTAEQGLSMVDDVLADVDVQDALIKDRPEAANSIRTQRMSAQTQIDSARRMQLSANDYGGTLAALDQGRVAVNAALATIDSLFSVVSTVRETASFSNSDREAFKATISAERSSVQAAYSAVSAASTDLRNAAASYDTRIATENASLTGYRGTRDKAKADIITYEASIQASEAQLALKKAGARKTDIDAARARVRQAQANVARASADLADTVINAPVEGVITHVNIKPGETPPAGAAISILGNSPFRIEMFVSEIDIPKVQVTQSGSIELDAYRGVNMKLRVSEVDPAATDKDGVSKYRVVLDFVHPHNELKIGMTGDAEIETGFKAGVLTVARRAVLEEGDRQYVRVLAEDGKTVSEHDVTLGMEDGSGDVEIMTGLKEGDTVIVLEK